MFETNAVKLPRWLVDAIPQVGELVLAECMNEPDEINLFFYLFVLDVLVEVYEIFCIGLL
jgi:hypothetical protein